MAIVSGKDGAVNSFTDITGWTLSRKSDNKSYVSSSTDGNTKRVAGNKDWSGTISGKFDGSTPVEEGESVALTLTVASGVAYTGTALIDSVDTETNIETGDIVGWSAAFSGNGALTPPS